MRWPWRRPPAQSPDDPQRHMELLEAQQPEVTRLAREFQEIRKRNHFTAMIEAALRGSS